jgi:hypothetical protein
VGGALTLLPLLLGLPLLLLLRLPLLLLLRLMRVLLLLLLMPSLLRLLLLPLLQIKLPLQRQCQSLIPGQLLLRRLLLLLAWYAGQGGQPAGRCVTSRLVIWRHLGVHHAPQALPQLLAPAADALHRPA